MGETPESESKTVLDGGFHKGTYGLPFVPPSVKIWEIRMGFMAEWLRRPTAVRKAAGSILAVRAFTQEHDSDFWADFFRILDPSRAFLGIFR